jgi:hypothetical protein
MGLGIIIIEFDFFFIWGGMVGCYGIWNIGCGLMWVGVKKWIYDNCMNKKSLVRHLWKFVEQMRDVGRTTMGQNRQKQ